MTTRRKNNKARRKLLYRLVKSEIGVQSNPKLMPDHSGVCDIMGCNKSPIMPLSGRCVTHTPGLKGIVGWPKLEA